MKLKQEVKDTTTVEEGVKDSKTEIPVATVDATEDAESSTKKQKVEGLNQFIVRLIFQMENLDNLLVRESLQRRRLLYYLLIAVSTIKDFKCIPKLQTDSNTYQ